MCFKGRLEKTCVVLAVTTLPPRLRVHKTTRGGSRFSRAEEYLFMDRAFRNEMDALVNKADDAFNRMMWREGIHSGFFAMQLLRDFYRWGRRYSK